jgi:flagellar biosynthetic protein FlhB
MAEQDTDRSESATPHKLDEARKKGNVARSSDLTAVAMLAALAGAIYANGADALRQALRSQQKMLAGAAHLDWSIDGVAEWLGTLLLAMLGMLGPLFLALMVVAVLVNLVQTGPIFSFHPLVPDLSRISPATGFKRLFSMRLLFETAKSVVKLAILGAALAMLVRDAVPGLLAVSAIEPKGYAAILLALAGALLAKLVLTLLAIALADVVYTRWEFGKRMRMSKRDVRDESKNREGDPRIRSRIRELRREMLKRSKAVGKVRDADVLITNPTRLAVALSYRHGTSGAPQLLAKGAGGLARQMRALANQHHIPIVQNKALARILFREVDYDGYVPEKLYPHIARIMVWVYSMREAKRTTEKGA